MKTEKRLSKKQRLKNNYIEDFIPAYWSHVNERVLLVKHGSHHQFNSLLAIIKVEGIPFESIDDDLLVKQFQRLNQFLNTLGKNWDNRLKLWLHFQRKKIQFQEKYKFTNYFSERLAEKYLENFTTQKFYENSFYISILLEANSLGSTVQEMNELLSEALETLSQYSPRILKLYNRDGVEYSEIASFLNELLTFKQKAIPITKSRIQKMVADATLVFGNDTLKIDDGISDPLYARSFELIDFGVTKIKILEDLLKLDAEFSFSQLFWFSDRDKVNLTIDRQLARFRSKKQGQNSFLSEQEEDLIAAKSGLESRTLFFGLYDAVVTVFHSDLKALKKKATAVLAQFERLNGYKFALCTIEHPNVFFSHLPGSEPVRHKYKTTTNVAATFPMQNFSTGKAQLNPLGDGSAIMPMRSNSDTLYFFNIHDTPIGLNTIGQALAGHILFLGKTGAGKTTLVAMILTFLDRFQPFIFSIDYKSGMEIFFKALGGQYFTLKKGESTGMNPFQLPDSPKTREFLNDLMAVLARSNEAKPLTARQRKMIAEAVEVTMNGAFENRNIRTFSYALDQSDETLIQNISIWLNEANKYGWVFDNAENEFDPTNFYRIAFDCKEILEKNYLPCEPILMYLFYLKEMMLANVHQHKSFLITVIEEFWYATKFPMTRDLIEAGLNAGRREFECMFLVSQYPEHAIQSTIFHSIAGGTSTKVFLANSQLNEEIKEGYIKCGLTQKEFETVADFIDTDRKFLIKQSSSSVVSKLDLTEVDPQTGLKRVFPEMKVLSTTLDNVQRVNELIAQYGLTSSDWVREFLSER
ncbi:MAG: hypothetical protein WDW21_02695 [Neisseriaceae bacterium]